MTEKMRYPRPIEQLHQIEVSTLCNLRCHYCPSRNLDKPKDKGGFGRAKEHITLETFERALHWAKYFNEQGTQGELALTGIGEALLHPNFVEMVAMARNALPHNLLTFSTNGILLTEELCEQLAPYRPAIYVSLHRPEKAKHAVDAARKYGLLADVNVSFATDAFSWANNLPEWQVSIPQDAVTCEFLRSGWAVVLADGRWATCCLDATGESVVGTVWDEPGSLCIQPWSGVGPQGQETGCSACHMRTP